MRREKGNGEEEDKSSSKEDRGSKKKSLPLFLRLNHLFIAIRWPPPSSSRSLAPSKSWAIRGRLTGGSRRETIGECDTE